MPDWLLNLERGTRVWVEVMRTGKEKEKKKAAMAKEPAVEETLVVVVMVMAMRRRTVVEGKEGEKGQEAGRVAQ